MNQLAKHLADFQSAPFLFVGSGFSRRYLGMPGWEELLRIFAGGLSHPYEYYNTAADGDKPKIATALADEFHSIWWADEKYAEHRDEYKSQINHKSSPLKVEIGEFLRGLEGEAVHGQKLKELNKLKSLTIDGIITTNWDCLLENLFPDYKCFIGQQEFIFEATHGIAEIYKVHGCRTKPDSLVLTSEDYGEYNDRNPYLAAKLLSVFVEHPTIFLGYSLSDDNIVGILHLVAKTLTTENLNRLQNRLIVVTYVPGLTKPSMNGTSIVTGGMQIPVVEIKTASYLPVFNALSAIKRKFPTRLLRQLKEHVYALVLENDPRGQIFVMDIDRDNQRDADVVLGVGAIQAIGEIGYKSITRPELFEDYLSKKKFDAKSVVEILLPELLRNTPYYPMCWYLTQAGYDCNSVADNTKLSPIMKAKFKQNRKWAKMTVNVRELRSDRQRLTRLLSGDTQELVIQLPSIRIHREDLPKVQAGLLRAFNERPNSKKIPTQLGKAVTYFDLAAYGPPDLLESDPAVH